MTSLRAQESGALETTLIVEDEAPVKRPALEAVPGSLDSVLIPEPGVVERTLESPYNAEHLDEVDFIERAVRTVPEALQYIPGVSVQKTAHGQGSPFIRGFTGYHTLFLIDGVRLNNASFRSGPNQYFNTVDASGLSSLDVVKSQGSVLYGSDAVGGTLLGVTRGPVYAESGQLAAGRSYTRLTSGESSITQRAEYSISEAGKYGFIIGGTYKNFGDIDAAGLGRLPKTGYGEMDFDAKLELFLNRDTKLTFFHQNVNIDDAWRTHSTIFSQPWPGIAPGTDLRRILDQGRYLSYVKLEGDAVAPFYDHYSLTLSHHRQNETEHRVRSNGRLDDLGYNLDSYGASADFEWETSWTDVSYGFDYYNDRADSFRYDFNANGTPRPPRIQGPIGDDAIYHLAGMYLNTDTPLNERTNLELGVRYTYAEVDIGRVEEPTTLQEISLVDHWDNVSGSGRITYRLDEADEVRLFAGVSQAFRAPGFSDLSRLDAARSNELETPAPGLSPETFVTYEAGIKVEKERFTGSLSYYYTEITDLIQRTPTGNVIGGLNEVTKQNIGDGHVQGVELSGSYQLREGVTLFGGFAYQDSLVTTFATSAPILSDEPLSRLLPINGFGGIRAELWSGRGWVEGLVQAFDDADILNTSDRADTQRIPVGGTPGYTITSVRSGLQVTDDLLLTLGLENVFDVEYRAHGSGQNEPGINAIFGAELTF